MSQLKFNDIEFFDFVFKGEGFVINLNRYIFYKNVYIFVNRLKNIVIIKNNNKIREVLSTCFRGEILI